MTKLKFECTTSEQNKELTHDFNSIQRGVSRGTITVREADFTFQRLVTENYNFNSTQRFIICTNRPNFICKEIAK